MKKEIIEYIKKLTNQPLLEYLQTPSKWFSESLVKIGSKNCYPYYDSIYDNFFFDKNISHFTKNVGLKFLMNKDINDDSKDYFEISKWIVKVWGGIKGIKDSSLNEIIDNLNYNRYPFKNISSWSKINSFENIKRDIIYDSKVIYSINWLLLKLNIDEYKFFLQPLSRNNKLTTFPLDTLINFHHNDKIDFTKRGESIMGNIYYKKNYVYEKYRDLIHQINFSIWSDESIDLTKLIGKSIFLKDYPFFTEMLLFNISDDVLYKDIIDSISIQIK